MGNCRECDRAIPEESKFCPFCGLASPLQTDLKCSKCKKVFETEDRFCASCGEGRAETIGAGQRPENGEPKPIARARARARASKRSLWLWLVAGLGALLVTVGLFPELWSDSMSQPTPRVSSTKVEKQSPQDFVKEFYTALSRKEIEKAHSMMSHRYQQDVNVSVLRSSLSERALTDIKEVQLLSESPIEARLEVTLQVTLGTPSGAKASVSTGGPVGLVMEDGGWRIDGSELRDKLNAYEIIPGYSVGLFRPGKGFPEKAFSIYGSPTSTMPAGASKDSGSTYWEGGLNVKTHDGKSADHVFSIYVSDPKFLTPKGIGVGSTLQELKAAYPDARQGWNEMYEIQTFTIPGASFSVDQVVHEIYVSTET